MVSAFLCECHGLLKLPESMQKECSHIPADSTVIMKHGTRLRRTLEKCWSCSSSERKGISNITGSTSQVRWVFLQQPKSLRFGPAMRWALLKWTAVAVVRTRDLWEMVGFSTIRATALFKNGSGRWYKLKGLGTGAYWKISLESFFGFKASKEIAVREAWLFKKQKWLAETVSECECLIDFYPNITANSIS